MFLGGQDYLSILCQANLLPILNFFVQEMMIITASSLAVSFNFRQLSRRLVLLESFYVTFLVEASALYFHICICLTDRN